MGPSASVNFSIVISPSSSASSHVTAGDAGPHILCQKRSTLFQLLESYALKEASQCLLDQFRLSVNYVAVHFME